MKKNLVVSLLVAMVAIGSVSLGAGDLVVDAFASAAVSRTLASTNGVPNVASLAWSVGGGPYGGERYIAIDMPWKSPGVPGFPVESVTLEINTPTSPSRMTVSGGLYSEGQVTFTYGMNTALSLRLAQPTLTIHGLHASHSTQVGVVLLAPDWSNYYVAVTTIAGNGSGQPYDLVFWCNGVGRPSLAHVNEIQVSFASAPAPTGGTGFSCTSFTVPLAPTNNN